MISSRKFIELRSLYGLASRANVEDQYRTGNLISLPAKGDVVVMGDLHGNLANLKKVVAAVQLDANPERHLILQEITHTFDTGEDKSFLLYEEVIALKNRFPDQVHILVGNHELSELTGKEILKGGICYNILFREGMKQEYGSYFSSLEELMHDFIKTLPVACITPNRIFLSHSTPELEFIPAYSLPFFQKGTGNAEKDRHLIERLVWGRDLSQKVADAFAARVKCDILIVGHTACKRGYQVPNSRHIVLDSKGMFATTLHFYLDRCYTQQELVKKCIQHVNPHAVRQALEHAKKISETNKEETLNENS